MAEPVLDPNAVAGELGELTAFATLNAFHNDWIAADGTRELEPADFLGGLSSWTHITTLGAAHTFTGDGTSGKWGNLGNIGSSLDLGAPQQPATVHALGITFAIGPRGTGTAYATHPVSPNPYTVPDLRNNADPNLVIDPSLVKDSTAGLQTYIDSCPSDAQIFLPFDLVTNGSIHLFGSQQLTVVNPVNGKKKLIRKESHPWRVRADRRTTLPASLGGGPNPANNPNGIVCDWQYDIFGGQSQIPTSQRNPWGQIVANSIDATHPNGIMRTDGDPTLVTPARSSGSDVGGFNGSTGVSGVDYDGVHFYVHYPSYTGGDGVRVNSAPFTTANTSGKILQVQTLPGGNGVLFNHFISGVSTDHKTVFFDNNDNSSVFQETSGTSAWAIFDNNSQGWQSFFVPNPKWEQEHDLSHNSTNGERFFSGTIPKPWTGISDALNDAMSRNQDPIVALHDSATLVGIEVSGSNTPVGTQLTQWQGAISGVVKSAPMIMEFTHGVATDTTANKLILCDIHNIPGHGEQGPGQILSGTKIHEVGMQAATAHWDGKVIDRSIFYGTSHASFDIESTGHEGPITITNNTFGGPHGMSWSSAADGLTYTGNHSVASDLVSQGGPIPDSFGLSDYTRVNFWLGGRNGFRSTNVVISDNQFDLDSSSGTDEVPAFIIGNCDGLTVTNNTTPIGTSSRPQWFLQPYLDTGIHPVYDGSGNLLSGDDSLCTNITCYGNLGGNHMLGQTAPGKPWGSLDNNTYTVLLDDDFTGLTYNHSGLWGTSGSFSIEDGGHGNYGNGQREYMTFDGSNLPTANGILSITARRQNTTTGVRTYAWTSGQIVSLQAFQPPCWLQIRCKMPTLQGFQTAFWTWGSAGDPNVGGTIRNELDVFEVYSNAHSSMLETSFMYPGNTGTTTSHAVDSTGWHTYGAEIDGGTARWYIDGVVQKTQTAAPTHAFNLITYMVVIDDGTVTGNQRVAPGLAVAGGTNSETFQVDRISVWKRP